MSAQKNGFAEFSRFMNLADLITVKFNNLPRKNL